jgi:hypothetical protein
MIRMTTTEIGATVVTRIKMRRLGSQNLMLQVWFSTEGLRN